VSSPQNPQYRVSSCWLAGVWQIARNGTHKARQVRIVELDGLSDKGDVSDWLQTHSGDELRKAMHASPKRQEPMSERKPFFAEAVAFAAESPVDPKASKSFHAVDLVMSATLLRWASRQYRPMKPSRSTN
jgi:hypothetical protein